MRHLPDGYKKWILHCVDHWSKFNFSYPLESKRVSSIAVVLTQQLFSYFGVPRILHSDTGREFVNSIIKKTLDSWHADIKLVSGHPQHPQTQGLVEQAHYTLQWKLSEEISRMKSKLPTRVSLLSRLVCKLQSICVILHEITEWQ